MIASNRARFVLEAGAKLAGEGGPGQKAHNQRGSGHNWYGRASLFLCAATVCAGALACDRRLAAPFANRIVYRFSESLQHPM